MPIGTTSKRVRSIADSTLPADTQEIACSVLRPPKTTATRRRRDSLIAPTVAVPTSAVVGPDRADEVGPERRADPHIRPGVRRLDHGTAADVHADVVDGVRVARVGREEQQV